MDNNTEDPNTTADHEALVADSDEVVEAPTDPEPVREVQKRGGGLSLLVALIALGGTGYLYYQQWQNPPAAAQDSAGEQLQPLKDADAVLETRLNNIKVDVDRLLAEMAVANQQLQSQASQLAQGVTDSNISEQPVFDNSANQAALDQLNEQLSSQARRISQLQQQLTAQQNTPVQTVGDVAMPVPDHTLFWQQQAAMGVLDQVALAKLSGQPAVAQQVVAEYLSTDDLPSDISALMRELNSALNSIQQPDVVALKQQLNGIRQAIDGISLVTKSEEPAAERSWYERFISVKKIDAGEGPATSTLALMSLKAELRQLLQQAEWSLTMQDQTGWEHQLAAVLERLQAELPGQQAVISQVQALRAEPVTVDWPDAIDLSAMKATIQGLES
jgi:hypothetical protein